MSTDQCQHLREAFLLVRQRPTKVIVLMGGTDFWSNGIHLNTIEAAEDPAHESWRNIQAINDLVRDIITTESHLVISAMQGNAAAGGVMLALAADFVYARKGIVLNPHYQGMGKLYGSEYWTYLLQKRVGGEKARELTEALLPISTRTAHQIGLLDDAFGEDVASFSQHIRRLAEELACSHRYEHLLEEKRHRRKHDEALKPLQAYREEELQQMWLNFFGADQSYHQARKHFVYKVLLPARDRALLDGTHQYTDAERHETGRHVEFVAFHDTGWHDSGQSTRDGSGARANMTAAILDGRAMSAEIKAQVRGEVRRFVEQQGQAPGLVIVRVGAGVARMVTAEMVKPGAVVIDVGTNVLSDGGMVGDVDVASVREVARAITPCPGRRRATHQRDAAQAMRASGVATDRREEGGENRCLTMADMIVLQKL